MPRAPPFEHIRRIIVVIIREGITSLRKCIMLRGLGSQTLWGRSFSRDRSKYFEHAWAPRQGHLASTTATRHLQSIRQPIR
jgi:hypothetical protein